MKVICERAALHEAIGLATSVVASRTPKPQLTCVKLNADKSSGELELSGTDAEIAITLRIGRVDVESAGAALVPAQKLAQIVQAEENEPTLTLETDDTLTHIRGEDAHFQLHGYPADEFPKPPTFAGAGGATFAISSGELSMAIARTLFATARENSRYAINGVLLKRDGKKVEMVATDGRRLALARATALTDEGDAASCIVPSKALTLVNKLIQDDNEPVHISVGESQIVFAFGEDPADSRAIISSNIVEGAFPPYEDVIPKDQDIRVGFDRDVLASAVGRAALLTNEESRGVRMAFIAEDKTLELSSRAPEMGEARVKVDLASFEGDDIEIGFNPGFITDALKVIDDPKVIIELKASNKPGLFRSGNDFVYVVMPVNLA